MFSYRHPIRSLTRAFDQIGSAVRAAEEYDRLIKRADESSVAHTCSNQVAAFIPM